MKEKLKNEKGLTKAGLLIIMVLLIVVIIALLMYFQNQKKRNFITMAKGYISDVRTLVTEDDITLPATYKEKVIISISQIKPDKELLESPFGGEWVIEKSYIILKNSGTEFEPVYDYYVALEDDKGNCLELTEESKLNRNLVTKNCSIMEYAETKDAYIE